MSWTQLPSYMSIDLTLCDYKYIIPIQKYKNFSDYFIIENPCVLNFKSIKNSAQEKTSICYVLCKLLWRNTNMYDQNYFLLKGNEYYNYEKLNINLILKNKSFHLNTV
jgi:hypothetical protein